MTPRQKIRLRRIADRRYPDRLTYIRSIATLKDLMRIHKIGQFKAWEGME